MRSTPTGLPLASRDQVLGTLTDKSSCNVLNLSACGLVRDQRRGLVNRQSDKLIAVSGRQRPPGITGTRHRMGFAIGSDHPARRIVDHAKKDAHVGQRNVELLQDELIVVLIPECVICLLYT